MRSRTIIATLSFVFGVALLLATPAGAYPVNPPTKPVVEDTSAVLDSSVTVEAAPASQQFAPDDWWRHR